MAVYVDVAIWERHGRRWCHLLADDPDELHAFAAALGCRRDRFQSKPARPWVDHYDVDEERRSDAVARGAVELTRREVVRQIARKRAAALAGRAPSYATAAGGDGASPTVAHRPSSTAP